MSTDVTSTLSLNDQFSKPIQNIINSLNNLSRTMDGVNKLTLQPKVKAPDLTVIKDKFTTTNFWITPKVKSTYVTTIKDKLANTNFYVGLKVKKSNVTDIQKQLSEKALKFDATLKKTSLTGIQRQFNAYTFKLTALLKKTSLTDIQKQINTHGFKLNLSAGKIDVKSIRDKLKNLNLNVPVNLNGQGGGSNSGGSSSSGGGNTIIGGAKKLLGAYVGIEAVGALIRTSDELTNISARIALVNDQYNQMARCIDPVNPKLQDVKELEELIFEAANRSRASYFDTAQVVARIGMNASGAFKDSQELVGFAELMQKSFVIAGTNAEEMRSAMLQLSQGMASNRLQGDELRSIFESAPIIAQYIADYMGVGMGEVRELAAEGKISAEIIKNAFFNASKDINCKFADMPKTFTQIWTVFKNKALRAWEPLYERLRKFANSESFSFVIDNVVATVTVLARVTMGLVDVLEVVFAILKFNLFWIKPAMWAIVGVWLAYNLALLKTKATLGLLKVVSWATTGAKVALALVTWAVQKATWAQTSATLAQTTAHWGLNAAIYACPLFWFVAGIIAIIAVVYTVIYAINKFADTSISATGVILGCVVAIAMGIYDTIAWLWNNIVWFIEGLMNGISELGAYVYNGFTEMFTGWIDGVQSAFWTFISWVANKIKPLLKIYDKLKGTNLAETLSSNAQKKATYYSTKRKQAQATRKTIDPYKFTFGEKLKLPYADLKKSYDWGYNTGQDAVSALRGKLDKLKGKDQSELDDLKKKYGVDSLTELAEKMASDDADNKTNSKAGKIGTGNADEYMSKATDLLGDIKDNTDKDGVDLSEYLREAGMRRMVDRMTDVRVTVPMNVTNNVDKDVNLDDFISVFLRKVSQAANNSADGIHRYQGVR